MPALPVCLPIMMVNCSSQTGLLVWSSEESTCLHVIFQESEAIIPPRGLFQQSNFSLTSNRYSLVQKQLFSFTSLPSSLGSSVVSKSSDCLGVTVVAHIEEADSHPEKDAITDNVPGRSSSGAQRYSAHGSGCKMGRTVTFNKCQRRNILFVGQLQLAQQKLTQHSYKFSYRKANLDKVEKTGFNSYKKKMKRLPPTKAYISLDAFFLFKPPS